MTRYIRPWRSWMMVAAAIGLASSQVHADASAVEVRLEVKPPDRNNPKS